MNRNWDRNNNQLNIRSQGFRFETASRAFEDMPVNDESRQLLGLIIRVQNASKHVRRIYEKEK